MSSSDCWFLTCIQVSQEAGEVVWYSHLFQNFPQLIVIHTVKGFGIVNKAEKDVFLDVFCLMIQLMLAIWSLVPLPFLKPAWTSGSSRFTYCWSLAWRILSITLLACESAALNMPANLENSAVAADWKRSVFTPISNKGNAKRCSNYCTIVLISHASKVMLKILQARLQQYVNHELPDVQAGFRKGRGTRDQIANIHWIIEKAREFQKKTSIFALLTMPKPLTVWIIINCGKFFKRWEYQTT